MHIGTTLAIVLGMLLVHPVLSAAPADDRTRERIAAERREADRRFEVARLQCEQRFAVTSCLEDARSERRRVLDRLAGEQAALDEVQRRARAAERLRAIQAKAATAPRGAASAASVPASGPVVRARRSARAASTAAAVASSPSSPVASAATARPSQAGDAPQAAARRRQAQQAREREAQAHRDAVLRRNAERDARKPPAAPLPLPSSPLAGGR